LFMGSEVHHYGYWTPDLDQFGDHRYDWALFNDQFGTEMRALVTDANRVRNSHPALRSDTLQFAHWDPGNLILAFKRWNDEGDIILTVVNIGEAQFNDATYGVNLGGESGRWEEIFNSQAPQYGGWNDSGNFLAFPQVQGDGNMYIRVPKRSVLIFRKT
jgi:1,4-alpha-glucan branching enzyme